MVVLGGFCFCLYVIELNGFNELFFFVENDWLKSH